jgi:hypothetical protein
MEPMTVYYPALRSWKLRVPAGAKDEGSYYLDVVVTFLSFAVKERDQRSIRQTTVLLPTYLSYNLIFGWT